MNTINQKLNTNIDDYSNDELFSSLELENPTQQDITNKIESLVSNYFNEDNKLRQFFYAVQNRLLNTFNNETNHLRNDILINPYNIETENNLYYNDETDNQTENEEETDNEEETIEAFSNLEDTFINNTTNNSTNNTTNNSTNKYEFPEIEKDKNVIENYQVYNYLHFNTLFRDKNNPLLESPIPATNSNFILSTPINNISQIKLASVNLKKPYLISESKSNNKFIIKKYVKDSTTNNIICDFSQTIIIDDGYYEDPKSLELYLNSTYFKDSIRPTNFFLESITFSINENSGKTNFTCDLSDTIDDASYHHFTLDFKTHYVPYYSLATILGFDYNKGADYYTSINNTKIVSKYAYSNIGNRELYFGLDEYQSNIIETHKLFLNNNMSTNKILAKVNATLGKSSTNYYINETFSKNNDRNDIIRKYDGTINLLNFNIKIIDYYGNIVNANINEDYTVTLEVKIENTRLLKDNKPLIYNEDIFNHDNI